MSQYEDQLIAQMKELLLNDGNEWVECVPEEDISQAEAQLGFSLPPLLRRIYLEIGDGAFGLSPLNIEDFSGFANYGLVDSYLSWRPQTQDEIDRNWAGSDDKPSIWPEKLLVIYDYGCNMYSCLDCAHPENRILRYDANISLSTYAVEAPSFLQWLQACFDGTFNFDWDKTEKVSF